MIEIINYGYGWMINNRICFHNPIKQFERIGETNNDKQQNSGAFM